MNEETMNIKQAAEACGLSPDTIRFYERTGVLPPPPRRSNGYRDYTARRVATLRLVGGLRHLRLSLTEMQRIAWVSQEATCADLRGALVEELDEVARETERQILELEHTRQHVRQLLSGLRRMRPRAHAATGAAPCDCVALVSAEAFE